MEDFLQLIINPGSTSTKVAVFRGERALFTETIRHSATELASYAHIAEQFEFRKATILAALQAQGISAPDLDAIVVRGGLLNPLEGGTYEVNELICDHLAQAINGEHASNLGALIGRSIAEGECLGKSSGRPGCAVRCFTADPVVVDELMSEARPTGIPEISRRSIFHALNQKAIARRAAMELGTTYTECNLIVVHLGGGVSVGAHEKGRVIDTNNALDGDGPFTPERAGTVPAGQLVDLCFSGRYDAPKLRRMLTGQGGLVAHLGTNDGREMAAMVERGDQRAIAILRAGAYSVAKEIGARAVALRGKIDAIVLTGSMAYFGQYVAWIREYVEFLAPILIFPGEDEMVALAQAGLRVLRGEEEPREYTGEAVHSHGTSGGTSTGGGA